MKFIKDEPSIDLDKLRLVSEGGAWELGIRSMIFGFRVSLSKLGDEWYTLDYCAADDSELLLWLLATVATILDRFPEDISERELQDEFPQYEFKPIKHDLSWGRLQEMAHGTFPPYRKCPVNGCGRLNYDPASDRCPCCKMPYPQDAPEPCDRL